MRDFPWKRKDDSNKIGHTGLNISRKKCTRVQIVLTALSDNLTLVK